MSISARARILALSALPILLVGCEAVGDHSGGMSGPDAIQTKWGYEGAGRAENWGRLSADYRLCETGAMQSPINLAGATLANIPDPHFQYGPTPLTVENLGHTAQVNYQPGSAMTLAGTRYELLQFHFHTPSEHRLQGREFPAELHLVHRGPGGELAVVGVLIEHGSENAALKPLIDNLPRTVGAKQQVGSVQINAERLLPQQAQHYNYAGSLTTPPCTEGVKWLVMDKPIQASRQQLETLQSVIRVSNRPVQPLGARDLTLDAH